MASVSLKDIIAKMKLENLTPELDIAKVKITQPDINRPALQMAGYFEHFEATRMQIIGFVEYTYMLGLPEAKKRRFIRNYFPVIFRASYSAVSCSRILCSWRWL